MRATTMLAVLAGGLLTLGGCATVQNIEKKAEAEVKAHPEALKSGEDGALTVAVKAELAKNAKTKPHNLDVAVKGGVVTLKGSAPADVKAEAEKAAKVPGVSKVENQITVK